MNLKFLYCTFENCTKSHKGHGYCVNHLAQFKRGTLGKIKEIKVCSVVGCNTKYYCQGYCVKHYQRNKKGLPINMSFNSKNRYIRGDNLFEHKDCNSWSKAIKQFVGDKCVRCGWNEAGCEAHHIIPKSKGGLNTLQNAIVLCPNCHKLADLDKLSIEYLQNIKNKLSVEQKGDINVSLDY
jgi:hypothetical protein